jgi:hypothetical protein
VAGYYAAHTRKRNWLSMFHSVRSLPQIYEKAKIYCKCWCCRTNIGAAGIDPSGGGLMSHNRGTFGESAGPLKTCSLDPYSSFPKIQRPVRLLPHTFSDARSPLHDTNRYTAPEKSEWYDFSPYSESPPPQGHKKGALHRQVRVSCRWPPHGHL